MNSAAGESASMAGNVHNLSFCRSAAPRGSHTRATERASRPDRRVLRFHGQESLPANTDRARGVGLFVSAVALGRKYRYRGGEQKREQRSSPPGFLRIHGLAVAQGT